MDLLDLWRPGSALTWRKLGVLVTHLPPESSTMTAIRASEPDLAADAAEQADPAMRPWSADQMLLASVIDVLRRLEWAYSCVHGKDKAPPPPEPVPRPGVVARPRKVLTVAAYRAMSGQEPPPYLVKGAR